jgi:hypothetical protein
MLPYDAARVGIAETAAECREIEGRTQYGS